MAFNRIHASGTEGTISCHSARAGSLRSGRDLPGVPVAECSLAWVVRQFTRAIDGDTTQPPADPVRVIIRRDAPPSVRIDPSTAPQWDWLNRVGLIDERTWRGQRDKFPEQHGPADARNSVMYLSVRYLSRAGGGRRSVNDAAALYDYWQSRFLGIEDGEFDSGSYYRFLRDRINPLLDRRAS